MTKLDPNLSGPLGWTRPRGHAPARLTWDPNQPRDERGRWGEGGGGSVDTIPFPKSNEELQAMLVDRDREHTMTGEKITADTPLVVFHGTERGEAEQFARDGIKAEDKPSNLARERYERGEPSEYAPGRGLSSGIYVSGHPADASGFGHHMVAMTVRAGDLERPPESDPKLNGGFGSPKEGLAGVLDGLSGADGAVITKDIPADNVVEFGARYGYIPKADISEAKFTYNPDQPRDYHGRWGEGDGKEGPEYVGRVVEQLYEGKEVEVPADQVTIVISELGRRAEEAQAAGLNARPVDLCDMSVEGTNLFCGDAFGIPKQEMPQIEDANRGAFRDSLVQSGVNVTDDRIPAEVMKATQGELNGTKVASMMDDIQSGNTIHLSDERSIFVSKDNYILDGHHRWAAAVGVEYADGVADQDITVPVQQIDLPILDLLDRANSFVDERGIARKALASTRHPFLAWFEWHYDPDQPRDDHGRWDGGAGADNPSGKDAIRMAPGTGSIVDRVGVMGGATVQPLTGDEPRTGYVIAREGTSTFVPSDEFFEREKGIDAIDSYLQEHADAFDEGALMGLWFDSANSEVVLDVVDNPTTMSRDEAIAEGADRNQQSIWDVERGETIDTGGSGGRDQAGINPAPRQAREEDLGDDRRGAQGVRREDPRRVRESRGEGLSFLDRFVSGQFYSEDQPRDDHGRWTDGGGESSTSEPGSAREAAQMLAEKAHEAEKSASPKMTRVAELAGGRLLGFDFREKQVDSMTKKIEDRMESRDLTPGQAADTISDSLRYTVGIEDPDIYTDGTRLAIDNLKEQGWTQNGDAKNYWVPGDQYQGINSNWYTETGQKVEVQFHTQESFDTKFASEGLFHEARDAAAAGDLDRMKALEAQQTAMWEGVTDPPDVMSIGVPKSASSSR